MKIFIYDFTIEGRIASFCRRTQCSLLTAQQVSRRRRISKSVHFFLDEVDALILEITRPTTDSQFILAQAMLAKKPILCLYRKNFPPDDMLRLVHERHGRTVRTFSYTKRNLAIVVQKFIDEFYSEKKSYDEKTRIKYTLRLSPKCDRYIAWVCKRERISKADYFRLFLEHQQSHDPNYRDDGPDAQGLRQPSS